MSILGRALPLTILMSGCALEPPVIAPPLGTWVEAQGEVQTEGPMVRELEQKPRSASDKAEKFTVTLPITDAVAANAPISEWGVRYEVGEKTEYVDEDGNTTPPFDVAAGDWVRVKARGKDDGSVQARQIRRSKPRREFEVEGELVDFDATANTLTIGSVQLRQDPRIRWRPLQGRDNVDTGGVDAGDPLAFFLWDEQKDVPFTFQLGDRVRLGGDVGFQFEGRDEYDLRRQRDGDRVTVQATAKVDMLWSIDSRGSFALLEVSSSAEERFEEGKPDRDSSQVHVSRAFVYWGLSDSLHVQIGRQDMGEQREWLYDEVLDGVRTTWRQEAFEVEAFAVTGREFVAPENRLEDNYFVGGVVRARINDDHTVSGYVIQRFDTTATNFEPWLAGIRSWSRPFRGIGHWLELAHAGGYFGFQQIDGYAVDAGISYRAARTWSPTLTAGYARGEGATAGTGRQGFRQLGIQDNNGKFGGVTSFRYYGEVLDPELSNLEVLTLGAGVRPARRLAFDLVVHAYRQDEASQDQFYSRLRNRPAGTRRDLGLGADLIIGYRPSRSVTTELVLGRFDPGDAFADRDAAHKVQFTMRLKW